MKGTGERVSLWWIEGIFFKIDLQYSDQPVTKKPTATETNRDALLLYNMLESQLEQQTLAQEDVSTSTSGLVVAIINL